MHHLARHLLTLAAAVSLLVTAPGTAGAASKQLVTPAEAKAIVLAYNVANNKANATYDTALQDQHEEGPARTVDDALFGIARRLVVGPLPATTLAGVRVFVPRQTTYPAVFVAVAHPQLRGEPPQKFTAAYVFRRDSVGATWKLADETNFAGAPPTLSLDAGGYLPALVPTQLKATPAKLLPAWITAQTLAGRGGNASASWARTSLFRRFVALTKPLAVHDRRLASSEHFAPICFASAAGGLCFVSTLMVDDLTLTPDEVAAGAGYHVDTADDQMSLGGVDRGVYVSLHLLNQRSVAITVPRKGAKAVLQLVAFDSTALKGRGVKA